LSCDAWQLQLFTPLHSRRQQAAMEVQLAASRLQQLQNQLDGRSVEHCFTQLCLFGFVLQ